VPVSVANGSRARVVLLVEDEYLVRRDIADCLREAGFTVIETASGEEAIVTGNSDISIDLIFTDINLGGLVDGWDVAHRFRADQPEVAVLYTSGKSIDPGRCVSGSAFVAKPYQHEEIVRACRRLCEK
jgi:two-component system, OmpR family, response regulator